MNKELGSEHLRWRTTDKEDHCTVVGEEQNNRAEMNVGERFGEDLFSAIRVVVQVVRGNYRTSQLRGHYRGRILASVLIDCIKMNS